MKFNTIKKESSNRFRRLTGIKKSTFNSMVKLLRLAEETRCELDDQVKTPLQFSISKLNVPYVKALLLCGANAHIECPTDDPGFYLEILKEGVIPTARLSKHKAVLKHNEIKRVLKECREGREIS